MAVAHTILDNGYHLQKNGCDYKDLGQDYFDRLDAAGLKRYLVRRLEGLGHRVHKTLSPDRANPVLFSREKAGLLRDAIRSQC